MSFDMNPADEDQHGECRHEIHRLEAECERLRRLVVDEIDVDRVLAWINTPDRKPADVAFTSGVERQAAYLIEVALAEDEVARLRRENEALWASVRRMPIGHQQGIPVDPECGCLACNPLMFHFLFIVCAICGNKRCPHAMDHRFACTGRNTPGQTVEIERTDAVHPA